jgi:hypothetical protein
MAKREVEDMVQRYRAMTRKKNTLLIHKLKWLAAGAVWACDFVDPPGNKPIENDYNLLMAVRDMGSGKQLFWDGIRNKESKTVIEELTALFMEYGPPLVIKADNESPLKSEEIRSFLSKWNVYLLLNPVKCPQYNGACEAGNGSMQTRTRSFAAMEDHIGRWTLDNLASAKDQANQTALAPFHRGMTHDEVWAKRQPMSDSVRSRFKELTETRLEEVKKELGILPGLDGKIKHQALVERKAISRALRDAGILLMRRRRISPPIKTIKLTEIS